MYTILRLLSSSNRFIDTKDEYYFEKIVNSQPTETFLSPVRSLSNLNSVVNLYIRDNKPFVTKDNFEIDAHCVSLLDVTDFQSVINNVNVRIEKVVKKDKDNYILINLDGYIVALFSNLELFGCGVELLNGLRLTQSSTWLGVYLENVAKCGNIIFLTICEKYTDCVTRFMIDTKSLSCTVQESIYSESKQYKVLTVKDIAKWKLSKVPLEELYIRRNI